MHFEFSKVFSARLGFIKEPLKFRLELGQNIFIRMGALSLLEELFEAPVLLHSGTKLVSLQRIPKGVVFLWRKVLLDRNPQ